MNTNIQALEELLKNAPTINVDVKHTIMGSSVPPVPPPPVINNVPNIQPPAPNSNGNSKSTKRVALLIVFSVVGGFLIIKGMQWWDNYKNKKNQNF